MFAPSSRALVVGALVFAVSSSLACTHRSAQGATVALDPDVDDGLGGTGIESGDVRAAADQIARAVLRDAAGAPRVAIMPVNNHTRYRIDAGLMQDQLVHDLSRHSRGRFGLVQAKAGKPINAASAILRTDLRSLTKTRGEVTSEYISYLFVLEDHSDGSVLWTGMYETKRLSDVDVVYR